ncbi:MAG: glycosyltransferase [Deltaproteobacteria bacterium]|nr:glycosyltransferase [Deltaproteobacteria bacterium]
MIRVAHVRDTFLRGTETFIYDIVTRHRTADAHIFCERRDHADQFPAKNIRCIADSGALFAAAQELARKTVGYFPIYTHWARDCRADLLHAHFGPTGYFLLETKKKLGIPLVTSFYGQDVFEVPAKPKWKRRYERLFKEGDLFLALSTDMTKDLVAAGCPASKIKIYRLGIDLTDFAPTARPQRTPVKILSVARMVEKKGYRIFDPGDRPP